MARHKETFAMEIIEKMKRQGNIWRMVTVVSVILNIIQLFL